MHATSDEIRGIQISNQGVPAGQGLAGMDKDIMLAKGIEKRHEGVTLFPSFALLHSVAIAISIDPLVFRTRIEKLEYKATIFGDHKLILLHVSEGPERESLEIRKRSSKR